MQHERWQSQMAIGFFSCALKWQVNSTALVHHTVLATGDGGILLLTNCHNFHFVREQGKGNGRETSTHCSTVPHFFHRNKSWDGSIGDND
ncbi:MAG: hypothetical protein V7L31_28905 [Nostoc sp.]|uniref:hypothetical protein n=1 Tax=Nostoc sp. TaxID=1180 RepID=UPI002FF17E48